VTALPHAGLKRLAAIRADLASGHAREAREATGVTVAEIAAATSAMARTTPQAVSACEFGAGQCPAPSVPWPTPSRPLPPGMEQGWARRGAASPGKCEQPPFTAL
jgi:hypothetical protein